VEALSLIEEFQPLVVPSPYGLIFFACLAFLILLLSARPKRPPYAALVPFLAALFAVFLAVRNVPLFALFAFPLLLGTMREVAAGWRWKPLDRPREVMAADDAKGRTGPLVTATVLILVGLAALSGRVGSIQLIQDEFSSEEFPVAAVARAQAEGLGERTMFNEYRWGGYLLYAWPEQRIFIDGMANFFGGALMEEYLALHFGFPGWEATLEERGVDMLLLPPDVPLVASAKASPDWEVWFEDPMAVILLKDGPRGESMEAPDASVAGVSGESSVRP
jgi:hypothetical protein